MDVQQKNRPHLEPIQEESEQEDEVEGSETGEEEEEVEEEEEDFQEGVETKEVMTADESEEDEDEDHDLLRVLRPKRIYRSHSKVSFPRARSSNRHRKETDSSVSEQSSHSVDLKGEETLRPEQARLGSERWSISDELRIKTPKIKWRKETPPQVPVQKTKRKRLKEFPSEPFPEWLVDLMFNIEEATTHQLLVE